MEDDSQLGNFKEDKKLGIDCLLNISLVIQATMEFQLKGRTRPCQCFETSPAGDFSGGSF